MSKIKDQISWQDFEKIQMISATIIAVEDFPEVRNPAYKLTLDCGVYGIKKTSAQITKRYSKEELLQQQVITVINFPKKQIANMMSECLVLGVVGDNGDVNLLQPNQSSKNGLPVS